MNHEPQTFADLQDAGNAQSQLLLQAIARHADWDTGTCHPRVATLARMSKCSEKTVRRHLKRLAEDGLIAVEERSRQDGSQGANQIVLIGYAEWITANRRGGAVARPRRARRYADHTLGVDADPVPEMVSVDPVEPPTTLENSAETGMVNLTTPLDNLTRGPGHLLTRGPGHLVSTHEPLSELKNELLPPTPQGGKVGGREESTSGWAKGWTAEARAAVDHIRQGVAGARVAEVFLDRVVGLLNPPLHVDVAAYIRQLAHALVGSSDAALAAAADQMIATQVRDLPAVGVIKAIVKAAEPRLTGSLGPMAADANTADPALAATWRRVVERLEAEIGAAAVVNWFATARVAGCGGGVLRLVVRTRFVKNYIDQHFGRQLRAAAAVERVEISVAERRAADAHASVEA
jgi:hypothetical protein